MKTSGVNSAMKRREAVRALLTPDAPVPPAEAAPHDPMPPARVASGAVRAMGLEIGRLAEGAREAEVLRQRLDGGDSVVDLPTDLVDPSFVSDRLASLADRSADAAFRRLVDSIRDNGQLVPILVRPHPDAAGRYQIAYGHRRRDALAELGRPVRAIIRPLTDAELVIAQGKENGERRDLSFIERALFAADLHRRGFDRATLNRALGVHTAEMTRLLAVAAAVPIGLIRQIGPAPKAGRLRWRELADELARPGAGEAVAALLAQPALRDLGSDRRFAAVIEAVRMQAAAADPAGEVYRDRRGAVIARIERGPGSTRLILDDRAAPGLAQFVLGDFIHVIARYIASRP
jgi:ParB family chromosome partitioning protein